MWVCIAHISPIHVFYYWIANNWKPFMYVVSQNNDTLIINIMKEHGSWVWLNGLEMFTHTEVLSRKLNPSIEISKVMPNLILGSLILELSFLIASNTGVQHAAFFLLHFKEDQFSAFPWKDVNTDLISCIFYTMKGKHNGYRAHFIYSRRYIFHTMGKGFFVMKN